MKQLFDKSEIDTAESEAVALLSTSAIGKIKTEADMAHAREVLTSVMSFKKQLQAKKDAIVKPINEALRQIRALFAPVEEKIAKAEGSIKSAILMYNSEIQAKLAAKQAETAKKVEAGEMTITKAAAQVERVAVKTAAIPTRKVKEIEIVDDAQIPDQYWVLDMVRIRKEAIFGNQQIPGVKVVEKEIIVGGR